MSGVLALSPEAFNPSTAADAAKPERITVAYCEDCLPFQYTGEDGRAYGTNVSFWRLWREKNGI